MCQSVPYNAVSDDDDGGKFLLANSHRREPKQRVDQAIVQGSLCIFYRQDGSTVSNIIMLSSNWPTLFAILIHP